MRINWKSSSKFEKVLWILQMAISVAVIILVILKLCDIYAEALNWAVPLLGLTQVIMGLQEWKQSKSMALISFCVAAVVFACTAAVFLL